VRMFDDQSNVDFFNEDNDDQQLLEEQNSLVTSMNGENFDQQIFKRINNVP
jgi:hypothetical protein